MKSLLLPLLFQVTFFIILILEFIIPSAGILTALSLASLGASWWLVISSPVPWLFSAVLVADLILIPVTLFIGFRLLQKSPLANRAELSGDSGYQTQSNLPEALVGQTATALSMLKPWGKVELAGQVYDATSTGNYVEPGTQVTIISVSGNKLTVEPNPS